MWPQPMQCYNYIIVCSDGVGRTGSFICIHAMLERVNTENVIISSSL